MLYFEIRPDEAFHAIVRDSLGIHIDELSCEYTPDEDAMWDHCEPVKACFSRTELIQYARQLLDAHESDRLYRISDYHFLILYDFLDLATTYHNDMLNDGEGLFTGIGPVDFHSMTDHYFWDTDFLLSSEIYDKLSPDAKAATGFCQEVFGIAHGMKPHPDEMQLEEIEVPGDWDEPGDPHPPGAPYPYYAE